MRKNSVTLKLIAETTGLSITTVSDVLNDRPGARVSAATRRKVLRAAEKLNYHPHSAARSLVTQKAHCVGIVFYDVDYITIPVFSEAVVGISNQALTRNYTIQLCTSVLQNLPEKDNYFFLKMARERRVDGLIIYDQAVAPEEIRRLDDLNMPYVLINRELPGADAPNVLFDHFECVRLIIEHLHDLGHKDILYIDYKGFRDHYTGGVFYRDCMEYMKRYPDLNVNAVGTENIDSVSTEEVDLEEAKAVLSQYPETTAIFGLDKLICKFASALKQFGLRLPSDMSLVGINNEFFSGLVEPPITTVHIPYREMGSQAFTMLLELLRGDTSRRDVVFKPTLKIRRSSAPPRQQATVHLMEE